MPYDSNSSQRGPSYETYQEQQNHAPYAHQLPPTEIASNTGNNNNYAINNQQNSNQAIGFGSSYTPYNNLNKPQTPYSPQFQPQQIQNSFNPFYNPQQPFGTTQNQQVSQQQPLFVNPFQPFLQQTYQVIFNKNMFILGATISKFYSSSRNLSIFPNFYNAHFPNITNSNIFSIPKTTIKLFTTSKPATNIYSNTSISSVFSSASSCSVASITN